MSVTVEDLGALLKREPPREIPRSIRKKKRGLYALVGFGAFFVLFSVPFMWLFFPWQLADELALDLGDPATISGQVVRVEKTNLSVGGGEHTEGTPVYAIHFTFETSGGETVTGVCYEVGLRHKEGQAVQIEYSSDTPSRSRVKGCKLNPTGYFGCLVIIFPLVGTLMCFFGMRARVRFLRLIRHGAFARGEVVDVKATNVTVNGQKRYKITVSYDSRRGQTVTTYNAYGEDVTVARKRMESAEQVGLLYDPEHPGRVQILDALLG